MYIPSFNFEGISFVLLNSFIVFLAVVISDRIMNHNISIIHSLILTTASYLLIPLISSAVENYVPIPWYVGFFVIPFVVWIILGEILLTDFTLKEKFKVAFVAFVVYILLGIIPVSSWILSLIGN